MAIRSLGQLTIDLVARIGGFEQGMSQAERSADRSQRKIAADAKKRAKEVEESWSTVGAVIGGAFSLLAGGALFSKFIEETKASEKEQALLAAALKATGEQAGFSQKRFNEMAAAMQRSTGIAAGQFTEAQTIITGFTNIVGTQVPKALQAAADISVRTGKSMAASAELVGRSLDIPSSGMSSLQKQGFKFTESQIAAAKALEETGRIAEAQGIVFAALEETYGGAAVAARDTLGGALQALQNEINSLMTGEGASVDALKDSVNGLADTMGSSEVQEGFRTVIGLMANLAEVAATAAARFVNFGKFLGETFGAMVAGPDNPVDALTAKIGEAQSELAGLEKELARPRAVSGKGYDGLDELKARAVATRKEIADLTKARDDWIRAANGAADPLVSSNAPDLSPRALGAVTLKDGDKAKRDKDAEAAKKYLRALEELASSRTKLTNAERVAFDLATARIKLTPQQTAQATALAFALDQRAEAEKRIAEAVKEGARVGSEFDKNKSLRDEIDLIGRNEYEQHLLNLQRQEAVILVKEQHLAELARASDLTGTMTAQHANLQSEIDLLRERLVMTDERYASTEAVKASKAAMVPWQKGVDSLAQSLTDQLMAGGKSFGEYLKSLGRTQIFQPMLTGGMNNAVGALGALGGGGGSTDAVGILSNLSSVYSAFSGGLTSTLSTSIGQLGVTFGSEALSSFALGMKTYLPAGMTGPTMAGAGGAAGAGSQFAAAAGGAAAFAAAAALVLNAMGSFRTDTKIGGGIQGTLGGEINAWEERRKGGTLFSGPSFNTFDPTGELEKQRAKLEELRIAGQGASATAQTLQTVIDSLEEQYGALAEATAAQDRVLQASYSAMRDNVAAMADVLGVGSTSVKNFTSQIKINFEGLDEAGQQAAVAEALATANNELAQQVLGTWKTTASEVVRVISENLGSYGEDASLIFSEVRDTVTATKYVTSEYAKDGEKAIDTLTRLASSLQTVRDVADVMSTPFYAAGLAGADAASQIADAFGGLQSFATTFSSYIDAYYSEEERRAASARAGARALQAAGLEISPDAILNATRESVRGFVEVVLQEFGPTSPQYVAAVQQANVLAGIFDPIASAIEDVADAASELDVSGWAQWLSGMRNTMDQAGAVWDKLGAAMGGSGTQYAMAKEARLWSAISEGSYAQQIEMAEELAGLVLARHQAESAAAQDQIRFARGLGDYVKSLMTGNLSPLTMGEKLAEAQRQAYATYEAAAGGDTQAQGRLQSEANTYLELARTYYASGQQYTDIFNTVTTALSSLSADTLTEAQQQLGVSTETLAQMQALRTVLEDAYFGLGDELTSQAQLLTDQTLVNEAGFENVADAIFDLPALLSVELNRVFQPNDTAAGTQLSMLEELRELRKAVLEARAGADYNAQMQVQALAITSGQNATVVSQAVTNAAYNQQLATEATIR